MDDEFSQDCLYKSQLLQAFGLEHWNDEKVTVIMEDIYSKIIKVTVFNEIIEQAKKNKEIVNLIGLLCNDSEEGDNSKLVFELLFRYDFFDLIHKCLSEYLREGRVKESTKDFIIRLLH